MSGPAAVFFSACVFSGLWLMGISIEAGLKAIAEALRSAATSGVKP